MAAISLQRCTEWKHAGHYQIHVQCGKSDHTKGKVAATHPWDMSPQHFHVWANVVILSMLHITTTRPCYTSLLNVPQCVLHTFLSLEHAPATWFLLSGHLKVPFFCLQVTHFSIVLPVLSRLADNSPSWDQFVISKLVTVKLRSQ